MRARGTRATVPALEETYNFIISERLHLFIIVFVFFFFAFYVYFFSVLSLIIRFVQRSILCVFKWSVYELGVLCALLRRVPTFLCMLYLYCNVSIIKSNFILFQEFVTSFCEFSKGYVHRRVDVSI